MPLIGLEKAVGALSTYCRTESLHARSGRFQWRIEGRRQDFICLSSIFCELKIERSLPRAGDDSLSDQPVTFLPSQGRQSTLSEGCPGFSDKS
jgi:hypothetical protein